MGGDALPLRDEPATPKRQPVQAEPSAVELLAATRFVPASVRRTDVADLGALRGTAGPEAVPPLRPWSRQWSRVQQALRQARSLRELAVDRAVELLGRGRQLRALPLRTRRSLPAEVTVVLDAGVARDVLEPDLEWLFATLRRRLGRGLHVVQMLANATGGCLHENGTQPSRDWRLAVRGVAVLASDLGAVAEQFGASAATAGSNAPAAAGTAWLHALRPLRAAGGSVVVLAPCSSTRLRAAMQIGCRVVPADVVEAPSDVALAAPRLLALLSVASRFDLALLRKVRRQLGESAMSAEVELAVLAGAGVRPTGTGSYSVQAVDPDTARAAWQQLWTRDRAAAQQLFATILTHQRQFAPLLGAEVVLLAHHVWPELVQDAEVERARGLFLQFAAAVRQRELSLGSQHLAELLRSGGTADDATRAVLLDAAPGAASTESHCLVLVPRDGSIVAVPASAERAVGVRKPGAVPLALVASRRGEAYVRSDAAAAAVPWVLTRARDDVPVARAVALQTERGTWHFERVRRPAWAAAFGCDAYGLHADLVVGAVRQRLRWIPPGEFLMGSPPSEPGRDNDEGPQRRVAIEHGYWLADTQCTQAMWLKLMGGPNPSEFESPERPVEQVSFVDAQRFLARLNDRLGPVGDGMSFRLPWEDEWEYAARAGTTTATYAGPMPIARRDSNNAPVLDAIAWYGGNSGVPDSLPNAVDGSHWPDKQYPHRYAATHPVAQKLANAWGLYDMLGNVWQWCEDLYAPYPDGKPGAWSVGQLGLRRVFRGGSFVAYARLCRSARRNAIHPGRRWHGLGFRLARGQVRAPAEGKASKHDPGESAGAGRGTRPRPPRGGA